MTVEQFTKDTDVVQAIRKLSEPPISGKTFSDLLDGEGHQYVDVVLQGGGVLGVALVGYTYALEQAGLRFRSIAGTSAGAINAMLIAALGPPSAPKSEVKLEYLANMKIDSFLDGPQPCVALSRAMVEGAGRLRLGWLSARTYQYVRSRHGIHPGKSFQTWIEGVLNDAGIDTTAKLNARMGERPDGLAARPGVDLQEDRYPNRIRNLFPGRLAIVAADAASLTKFVFPKMAELLFDRPDEENPARYVRASMAIPGFFEPVRVPRLGSDDAPRHRLSADELRKAWELHAGIEPGERLTEHTLIDGGVISNFPIAEFHSRDDRVPLLPTFGAKLGPARNGATIGSFGALAVATFNSARQALDFDFLYRNPDYRHLIATIDTSPHNWLDFDLKPEARVELFRRGVEAAVKFLGGFDWDGYKEIRRSLAGRQLLARAAD